MASASDAKAALDEALDDVESRFLYNVPVEYLQQVDRLFFQIEQAYWYYEDFKADLNPVLPHFSNLKTFATKIFSHCPLLHKVEDKFQELFSDFRTYKSKIPVYGTILLNPAMSKVLLVCDYQSNTWTFPRGKVNENETAFTCAMRETYEETGFNPTPHCRDEDNLEAFYDGRKVKLYIGTNVSETTKFVITTRKEISKIGFHPIDDLPKTYGVNPFLTKLKRWLSKRAQRKGGAGAAANATSKAAARVSPKVTGLSGTPGASASKKGKNQFDMRNADTFDLGDTSDSASALSGAKGWSVADMFNTNAKITGRDYNDYDGNPHAFGSAHPRYVDYNKQQQEQQASAQHAHSQLEASASAGTGISYRDHFALPESVTSSKSGRNGASQLFPINFQFDVRAIMEAVNTAFASADGGGVGLSG